MVGTSIVHKKLVVVGDGYCGKTSLLMMYKTGDFPNEYVPTVFDADVVQLEVDKTTVMLGLFDTAGQEDYDRLRPLSYPQTDVVLICFSLGDADTLVNVAEKWAPEVHHFCPGIPVILVGTKRDLQQQNSHDAKNCGGKIKQVSSQRSVQKPDALMIAQKIGATTYVECSAKLNQGITQLFETASRVAMQKRKKKKRHCQIL